MPPVPDIVIPAHLRPADGRFGSGPSKVRPEAVARLAAEAPLGTSHRQAPVRELVARTRRGLRELFALPDDYDVVLGNGGASQFWDVATHCLIERRSAHAVFGEFSGKFATAVAAAPWLEPPVRVEAEPGSHPTLGSLDDVDSYALTHNETSTGVAMPITRPGDGLVLVDATSGAGAIEVDPAAFDTYYFAPQKAFASDGGLWLALLSPAAVEGARALQAGGRYVPASLDLTLALTNSRQEQTVNTPAVATLFFLADQVEWLLAHGGLAWSAKQCAAKAAHLYDWADARDWATPFVSDPAMRSPVVCTIDLDAAVVDAGTVSAVLRANGIIDTDAYRKLGRNQLRIGVYPAVDAGDVEALTAAIDHVVSRLAA